MVLYLILYDEYNEADKCQASLEVAGKAKELKLTILQRNSEVFEEV